MTSRIVAALPRSSAYRARGNTVLGLIIGVVVGLGIAMIVALFITKATVPFVNKSARPTATDPDPAKLPDPNKSLYSKDTPIAAVPGGVPTVIAPPPPNVAPGADGKAPVVDRSTPDTRITLLQAGAFSSTEDADSMRGKLALLGFDSRVVPGERDGAKLYRVRLGPYARIEDLNRARQRLIENGVEATLVAPGK
jgi:cell division protein FtsN